MRKSLIMIFALMLLVSLTACNNAKPNHSYMQYAQIEAGPYESLSVFPSKQQYSFSECMDLFPYVVIAEPDGEPYVAENGSLLIQFMIEEIIQGDIRDRNIILEILDTEIDYSRDRYLLFLERFEDVMSGTTTYVADEIVYMAGETLYSDSVTDIVAMSFDEVIANARTYAEEHPYKGDAVVIGEYIKSTDLNEIYEGSDCVFAAIVEDIEYDEAPDRTIVLTEITEVYKGDASEMEGIVVPKHSVKVGNEYVFFANKPDETARFFIVSSQHSIHTLYETAGLIEKEK